MCFTVNYSSADRYACSSLVVVVLLCMCRVWRCICVLCRWHFMLDTGLTFCLLFGTPHHGKV